MKRPTIADLARAAGVSLSTVDRVVNGRNPVRADKADLVLRAAREIGFRATGVIERRVAEARPERTFGFLLQQRSTSFYRLLGQALETATREAADIRGRPRVEFLDDLSPQGVSQRMVKLGRAADALAVVTADHPRITGAIDELAAAGVPVVALVSDLTAGSRAGYVGLDSWKVGRTAAWAISRMGVAGEVAIFVGSHRYRCQEVSEISFRSFFREHAPEFALLEPLTSLEDPRFAYENTLGLLKRRPNLRGLFVAGGGIEGVMQALREEAASDGIVSVALDLTPETRAGLIDATLDLVLSHPLDRMAEATVAAMTRACGDEAAKTAFQTAMLPFEMFTSENV